MTKCNECGAELSRQEMATHFHKVRTVSKENGVYLILIPDGSTPGRWEAAVDFAEAVAELREKIPGKSFTFATFDHEPGERYHGVNAWLAVAM